MIFFHYCHFCKKNYIYIYINFLSTCGKSNLTYLTPNVMFSGQRFAILAMFLWRGCMIFFMERLRDFC